VFSLFRKRTTLKLIVGLGNPGNQYRHTRHNVGFEALDRLAEMIGLAFDKEKFKGQIALGNWNNSRVMLLKPLTYMNKSGESVAMAARNNVDNPEDILVLYDDVDLPLGRVRIRKDGSAGTHNGMKSVVERLGTRNIPRLRMGVGQDMKSGNLADHVLSKFRPDEREQTADMIERSAKAALTVLETGLDSAMNEYNKR